MLNGFGEWNDWLGGVGEGGVGDGVNLVKVPSDSSEYSERGLSHSPMPTPGLLPAVARLHPRDLKSGASVMIEGGVRGPSSDEEKGEGGDAFERVNRRLRWSDSPKMRTVHKLVANAGIQVRSRTRAVP